MDVAVVGAGIVGLAHAWAAAKRGHRVTVFERSPRAQGASVRNFGMVWPIGQTAGEDHATALLSRELWREAVEQAGLWHDPSGSITLATRPDEAAVLEEFAALAPGLGYDVALLDGAEAADRCPAARRDAVIAGLFSPTELCVNPREALATLPRWLAEAFGVEFRFDTAVRAIDGLSVVTTAGDAGRYERVFVCSGDDLTALYPDVFAASGIRRCKLQMMRTVAQPAGWKIGPMIASGLTLRHYRSFEICGSLDALRRRIREQTPELDRFGIHVMASQHGAEVVLGDSHEYGDSITPFDSAEIDGLILRELRRLIDLPDWTIAARWHGTYGKLADGVQFVADPEPGVRIVVGTGGAGMTMAFGLAERMWRAVGGT